VGQQPACADFLIAQGVKRVVIGQLDPNPLVNGQGVQKLTLAGVEVITGVLSKECEDLNEVFNYYIKNKLPWVTMKAACSLDGKIGYRGEETKITGLAAQKFTHLLRSKHQAILIGAKTALVDNPALTVRFGKPQRQPLRVVLDSSGATLNQDLKIFQDQQYLIFTSKLKVSESSRVIGVDATSGGLDLRQVLQNLALRKISSVLVEGGGKIFTSFLSQQLVNKVYFFVAYKLLAKNSALTLFSEDLDLNLRLKKVKNLSLAEDLMIEGYL
jgi:diaminohydroxyphosphoribosylaminopyrimidine deaminase/5-amino-6-(5-phosphoribosylamino)uracil reductase